MELSKMNYEQLLAERAKARAECAGKDPADAAEAWGRRFEIILEMMVRHSIPRIPVGD